MPDDTMHPREAGAVETCRWYLLCTNKTDRVLHHPALGAVPTCTRCATKHGMEAALMPNTGDK